MKTFIMAGVFAISSVLFFGCNLNTPDNAVDCNNICERYKECYDADYDTGACVDRCLDDADTEGYATKADACDACLDDQKSCAAQTFACATQCADIVP